MSDAAPLCVTVDVDTHDGMRDGVPRLLDAFKRHGVRATFFLSMGPDRSGRAMLQMALHPRFTLKMIGTGAPSLYGWRTIFSGTLLPARPIASAFPELVRRIVTEGHEAALHAWDHRAWQDELPHFKRHRIRAHYQRALDALRRITGSDPVGCRAPAWMTSPASLRIQDGYGHFRYASDLRASPACRLRLPDGHELRIPQFPGSGPCLEELLPKGIRGDAALGRTLAEDTIAAPGPIRSATLHAEVEGGIFHGVCDHLLPRLREHGPVVPMAEAVAMVDLATLPLRDWRLRRLPGRAFKVSTSVLALGTDLRRPPRFPRP